jgi:hypothetical protein
MNGPAQTGSPSLVVKPTTEMAMTSVVHAASMRRLRSTTARLLSAADDTTARRHDGTTMLASSGVPLLQAPATDDASGPESGVGPRRIAQHRAADGRRIATTGGGISEEPMNGHRGTRCDRLRRWTVLAAVLAAGVAQAPTVVASQTPAAASTLSITLGDGDLTVAGEGCTGGRTVTLDLRGRNVDAESAGDFGEVAEQVVVVPSGDGSWTLTRTITADRWELQASAECGDDGVDGFIYESRQIFAPTFADLAIEGIDLSRPVATDAALAFEVVGSCFSSRDVTVRVQDILFETFDRAGLLDLGTDGSASVVLTTPSEPGSYYLVALCGSWLGMPEVLTVVAAPPPTTSEPTLQASTTSPDRFPASPVAPAAAPIASSITYTG